MEPEDEGVGYLLLLCALLPIFVPFVAWFFASFGDAIAAVLVTTFALPLF